MTPQASYSLISNLSAEGPSLDSKARKFIFRAFAPLLTNYKLKNLHQFKHQPNLHARNIIPRFGIKTKIRRNKVRGAYKSTGSRDH